MNKEQAFLYKIKHDRKFYFENFLKIRNKKSQLIPFKLNDAQKMVIDIIKKDELAGKPKRYLVLKARKMGLSTLL